MIKETLKKIYFKITGKFKQRKFVHKDFTIISNNCFAGIVYRNNALPYNTPTAGLFFMADDYIKFIYNMKEYLNKELVEIKLEHSKYIDYLNKINYNAPIGKLGDIEIMFLHYPTFQEAKDKWDRRKKRINYDKIIYKFSEQNECTYEHLKKFNEFEVENKICFTYNKYPELDTVQFTEFENSDNIFSDVVEKIYKKYFDIYDYVKKMVYNPRILMVLSDLDKCNGISSYVMNYYNQMNTNKIKIDFVLTSNKIDVSYKKSIEHHESNLFVIDYEKSFLEGVKKTKKFLKSNHSKYDIIHSHLINKGYFFLKYAKKYGIKARILHSHNTTLGSKNFVRNLINKLFKTLTVTSANIYFACSNLAGDYLFNKRKYKVINNAINITKFSYSDELRKKHIKNLNLENKFIIGQVGRIAYQKNHLFFCNVLNELVKKYKDVIWVIVGDGDLEVSLKQRIKELKIEDNVMFLGKRMDINELYSAFDLLVMPSFFEGLPVVAIEAQANGLPCLLSNLITEETKLIPSLKFLPLEIEVWVKAIQKNLSKIRKNIKLEKNLDKYNIKKEVEKLEKIYSTLYEEL